MHAGRTGMGNGVNRILIEEVARGLGVRYVKVVDPFKTREAIKILKEALKIPGPSVVVFRAPCTLLIPRERRDCLKVEAMRTTDECTNCLACFKLTGCPAVVQKEERVVIDENYAPPAHYVCQFVHTMRFKEVLNDQLQCSSSRSGRARNSVGS